MSGLVTLVSCWLIGWLTPTIFFVVTWGNNGPAWYLIPSGIFAFACGWCGMWAACEMWDW